MHPILSTLHQSLNDSLSLLYPRLCAGCGNVMVTGETHLCADCILHIPITDTFNMRSNWVEKLFWGRVDITYGCALCAFRSHTRVQDVLHNIKYRSQIKTAEYMGGWLGSYLINSPFNTCDILIPIPLHKTRLKVRGFNQSAHISYGIGRQLNKPVDTKSLVRHTANVSQTKKTRFTRWDNVHKIFDIAHAGMLAHKHILLVDDVITTGATLESAATLLLTVPGVRVSIAALACAMQ